MVRFIALLPWLLSCGCAYTGKNGTEHHVIIGFGIVNVTKTNSCATVVKVNAVGIYAGTAPGAKFTAGYVNQVSTEIQPNANTVIEIKK